MSTGYVRTIIKSKIYDLSSCKLLADNDQERFETTRYVGNGRPVKLGNMIIRLDHVVNMRLESKEHTVVTAAS